MKAVEGWKKCKVRDICELGRGRVISGQEIERNPGVFPVFSSQSSNNGKMGAIDTFDFDGEYVTWTTDGAYAGTVFYRSGQFNCTNVCGTLHAKDVSVWAKDTQVCMPFLANKLSTLAKDYVSYIGNPKLMNGVMANIEISIPISKPEQTKIAEILSTVDRAIEQTEALIAKQQRIKTGLMQDLLTSGIDEHGNLRSEKTHHFKDSPLGRIPVEWEVKRLEELTTKIGDGIHTTPDYSVNTDYFFINGNNLNNGSIKLSEDTLCVDKNEYKKHYIYLDEQTILYSINGTIGNIAFYKNEKVILGKSAAYISCKKDINPMLIYFILQTEQVKDFYDNEMTGSTIKNLSLASIRKTPIKMPTGKVEQELLANKIDLSVKTKTNEESKLFKLRSLKTALMQDLLTGEKRVTPLLTEPQEAGA